MKKNIIICILLLFSLFCSYSHAETPQEAYNRGTALFNDGQKRFNVSDFHGAVRQWEKALAIFSKFGEKQAIGAVIGNLGNVYSNLGDYHKAISFYEKALTIAEEIGDKKGKGQRLGNLGNVYSNLGDYHKAISFYERSLAIAEEIDDKKGQGQRLSNLGSAYLQLGDYHKAISFYEKSLVIDEEIGDKRGKGKCLGNLGHAYNNLGDYRKAISFYERSLAIAQEIGDKQSQANWLGSLGAVYGNLGDYQKVISFYEKALTIAEEIGDKRGIGTATHNLGNAYSDLGDYRKAIIFYEKALTIAEEISNKRGIGTATGSLGSVYFQLGAYRKAIIFYEKALTIAVEIGDKQGQGNDLGDLGSAYSDLGDYRKAIIFYEKALAIAEEIGDKQSQANWHGNLGIVYSDLGDYRKAISFYEKAIEISKEIIIPYITPEGNLADAYLALDRDDEAFSIYTKLNHPIRLGRYYLKKKAFARAKGQFNRDREQTEEAKMAWAILPQWIGLGISNEGLKEYEEAYKWYIKAITFMEEQRAALITAEREHYFEGKVFGLPRIAAYEGAVRCAFMLGKLDEAFYWAENTRGRVLSELLSRRHAGENFKIPSALSREEEELTTLITINRKQKQTAFQKDNSELLKQAEDEYPNLRQKMENLIDRLRKDYPQYAAIKYPQPVKLSQIALKRGETIIEYEVTDPYTLGFVIRDGSVIKSFKVDKTRTELEAMVRKFRAPFQDGATMNEFSLNLAKDLTDLLIEPVLPFLKKGEHLIIIPDESLNLLPLEALLLSVPADALKEEAALLAQSTKRTDSGTIDRETIVRGLTQAPTTRSNGGSVAPRVTTHILFDTDSAQIKKESQKQLQEMTAALQSKALKNASIRIEGHTDSVGAPKYNMKLSFKRAQAVYDYLAKRGIRADRLTYTGKGDTEPIADNKDDAGKRLNRRVDFVRIDSLGERQASQSSSVMKEIVYAMDEYPISYYQSASILTLQRGLHISRTKEQTFFGLGDPVFDAKDKRASDKRSIKIVAKKTEISSNDIADNEETKDAGYKFSRLVNTAKEVKEVGKLFNTPKLMLGIDASEEKIKKEDLASRKYVLFSTHGILGNEIPYIKQPALVLSLVGNDQEDGFLTASEIFNLDLNADIVGLSACKTGLGVQSAGEGVVGLSRAFMYAGTDTVLVSLWSVSDESTYKLMVKFFDGLKSGKDKMTALKEAKDYLRNNGYDNPFYWAPFILMGEAN